MATFNVNFKTCSDRTKRRRINSRVTNILTELSQKDKHESISMLDNPDITSRTVNDISFSSCKKSFDQNANRHKNRNKHLATFDRSQTEFSEMLSDSIENKSSVDYSSCGLEVDKVISTLSDDTDDNNKSDEFTLGNKLQDWAITYRVSHSALGSLLRILNPLHSNLPIDSRTLLNTRRNVDIKHVAGGEYYYFGVKYWIQNIFKFNLPNSQVELLHIHINIDGVPLFNSNSISFWPILGSLKECPLSGTFPIAIYSSTKKPTSLDEYLNDIVSEMKTLKQHGFLFNNKLTE
ncbi:uncharacterized protein LOC105849210 isoform X1 [Hydra vulgaris]|uniref:uncharacterized protein LOC105849210 isoform X1 n=1 Tax=Hydra vulgaris TaxID=6087 RepID=UPI0032EA2D05